MKKKKFEMIEKMFLICFLFPCVVTSVFGRIAGKSSPTNNAIFFVATNKTVSVTWGAELCNKVTIRAFPQNTTSYLIQPRNDADYQVFNCSNTYVNLGVRSDCTGIDSTNVKCTGKKVPMDISRAAIFSVIKFDENSYIELDDVIRRSEADDGELDDPYMNVQAVHAFGYTNWRKVFEEPASSAGEGVTKRRAEPEYITREEIYVILACVIFCIISAAYYCCWAFDVWLDGRQREIQISKAELEEYIRKQVEKQHREIFNFRKLFECPTTCFRAKVPRHSERPRTPFPANLPITPEEHILDGISEVDSHDSLIPEVVTTTVDVHVPNEPEDDIALEVLKDPTVTGAPKDTEDDLYFETTV